jgi:hypothetical protein
MVTMVTMVTMGGDLQPGCLADRLVLTIQTCTFDTSKNFCSDLEAGRGKTRGGSAHEIFSPLALFFG